MKLVAYKEYPNTQGSYNDKMYNCNIDARLCRTFYIPFNETIDFSKLSFYAEYNNTQSKQIVSTNYYVVCNCDATTEIPITPIDFVAGLNSNNKLYTTFNIDGATIPLNCDIFSIGATIVFTTGQISFISQQFKREKCEDLSIIESCKEYTSENDFDSNGNYIGYVNAVEPFSGNTLLRYKHNYIVRNLSIRETSRKLTFSSNGKKNTQSEITKSKSLFIADSIPSFYLDYINEGLANGLIKINEVDYNLSEITINSIKDCCNTFNINAKIDEVISNYLPCVLSTDCIVCEKPNIKVYSQRSTEITIELLNQPFGNLFYNIGAGWIPLVNGGNVVVVAPGIAKIINLNPLLFYTVQLRNDCDGVNSTLSNIVSLSTYKCKVPKFITNNVTYYSIDVLITNFESSAGHSYDISFNNGSTWIVLGTTTANNTIAVTSGQSLDILVRHNCPNNNFTTSSLLTYTIPLPQYCLFYNPINKPTLGTYEIILKDQYGNEIVNTTANNINYQIIFNTTINQVHYSLNTFVAVGQSKRVDIISPNNVPLNTLNPCLKVSNTLPPNTGAIGTMSNPKYCNVATCLCDNCIRVFFIAFDTSFTYVLYNCDGTQITNQTGQNIIINFLIFDVSSQTWNTIQGVIPINSSAGINTFVNNEQITQIVMQSNSHGYLPCE